MNTEREARLLKQIVHTVCVEGPTVDIMERQAPGLFATANQMVYQWRFAIE